MATFASKAEPDADKLRGGYYTPDAIARFVASWVGTAGPVLLEPSCGDGAILTHLAHQGDALGVELIAAEAEKASAASGAPVVNREFFSWLTRQKHGTFDGVAGNPPYIRFGSWTEAHRTRAFDLMKAQGLKPTRLTNAWVPFVVGSVVAARVGGRIGLVVPAELLQVGYAAPLRAYLVDQCSDITVVSFRRLVFPGILQEVVLLLAVKGDGPAAIRTIEVQDASELDGLEVAGAAVRAPLHASEKWTKYYLGPSTIEHLRAARADARLKPMSDYAAVNVGVVTGRNSFFCLSEDEALDLNVARHTVPLLSRSAHLEGVRLTDADVEELSRRGAKTRLLALAPDFDLRTDPALAAYVALGEREGVHDGYKCRIRAAWWSVPSTAVPQGFMLRQVSTMLRLSVNEVGATSTDTVHRVFTRDGVDMGRLAVAAFNSITVAMSEVIGRSYGGGILEMEPSECAELPVPDPALVPDGLVEKVDELVRARRLDDALDAVDQAVLIDGAGFTAESIRQFRTAGEYMRARRLGRGGRAGRAEDES